MAATSQAPIATHSHTGREVSKRGVTLSICPPPPWGTDAPGPAAQSSLPPGGLEALGSLLRGGATASGRKGKAEMRVVWEVTAMVRAGAQINANEGEAVGRRAGKGTVRSKAFPEWSAGARHPGW